MPLHRVVQRLDVAGIKSDKHWRKVMGDHGRCRMTAAPTVVGIACATVPVVQRDSRSDQVEMRLGAVLGVHQHFVEWNSEQSCCDGCDPRHFATSRRILALG